MQPWRVNAAMVVLIRFQLDLFDRATVNGHGGDRQSEDAPINRDIVTVEADEPERGNDRQYALRRLRKDRPDLHAEVMH